MMSPTDPRREAIVARARGEAVLGVVHSKSGDDPDETGHRPRKGWPRLLEYFHTAAPNTWDDDLIHYLKDGLPAWCGIFALWSIKSAGFPVGNWVKFSGISSVPGIVNTAKPMKGDIGYIKPNNHHFIIARVDPNGTIFSIDGNSGIDGEVTFQARTPPIDAFYTISDSVAGFTNVFGDLPADPAPVPPPLASPSPPWTPAFPSPGTPAPPAPTTPGNATDVYVVQGGDSLSVIARKVYGDANQWSTIYQANRATIGPDPGRIYPGQQLVIP